MITLLLIFIFNLEPLAEIALNSTLGLYRAYAARIRSAA